MTTLADPRLRNDQGYKAAIREELAEILGFKGAGYKHDSPGTPTAIYAHGPEGVFTFPGVNPEVFSATIGVESGMIGILPKTPSVFTNPVYLSITGVQDDIGAEVTNVCDNAPTGGLIKTCKLTSVFGRYQRATREIYLDRLGMRNDFADPSNLRLMNSLTGNVPGVARDNILYPQHAPPGEWDLNLEVSKVFMELGVSISRLLSRQLWTGSPANNSAAGEAAGFKELTGFELLVNTGKVDAETNTACPALDSDVKDFNFANVDGSDGPDIVNVVAYLYRFVRSIARKTGLDPVEWVFAMREELFYELSAVWPCRYDTYRCQVQDTAQATVFINGRDEINRRDDMRQNRYLLVDGVRIGVVFDDGITELNDTTSASLNAGEFSSDIYLIPLTVSGGVPVSFMEYFQHQNTALQESMNRLPGPQISITNNGAWIWTARQTNLCFVWQGKVEPRLVIRTPQLAGRIQNVKYIPLQHTRQPFPDDPYFVNGGVTSRIGNGPSFFNEWQS